MNLSSGKWIHLAHPPGPPQTISALKRLILTEKYFKQKKKFNIHLKEPTHWHTHLARPPKKLSNEKCFHTRLKESIYHPRKKLLSFVLICLKKFSLKKKKILNKNFLCFSEKTNFLHLNEKLKALDVNRVLNTTLLFLC